MITSSQVRNVRDHRQDIGAAGEARGHRRAGFSRLRSARTDLSRRVDALNRKIDSNTQAVRDDIRALAEEMRQAAEPSVANT